jgi:hypothetical protein
LGVPITAFFETPALTQHVVLQLQAPTGAARSSSMARWRTWPLALPATALHPCLVTLEPHTGSGAELIVHTGYEFAFCLRGQITYTVDDAAICWRRATA